MFKNLPNHLILSDRIYKLSISIASNSVRASNRGLLDFRVEGINPLYARDNWRTLLGMSEELCEDYL